MRDRRSTLGKGSSKNDRKLPAGVFVSTFVGTLLTQLATVLTPTTPVGTVFQAFYLALAMGLAAAGVAKVAIKVI